MDDRKLTIRDTPNSGNMKAHSKKSTVKPDSRISTLLKTHSVN